MHVHVRERERERGHGAVPNRQGANRHSLAPDEDEVSEGKGTVKVRKENVRVFSKNCNLPVQYGMLLRVADH